MNKIFFDLETQKSNIDVGWRNVKDMKMSVAITFDDIHTAHVGEESVPGLIERLKRADLVIGYSIKLFDYKVLSAYTDFDLWSLPTFDLLEQVQQEYGVRVPLSNLAWSTLREKKDVDGLHAVQLFKEGKTKELVEYCYNDVEILRKLYAFGCKNGYLMAMDKFGHISSFDFYEPEP